MPVAPSDGGAKPAPGIASNSPAVTQESAIADLPPIKDFTWQGVGGLNVQVLQGSSPVAGQPVWRITAVQANKRHTAVVRIGDFDRNRKYRITAWVKPQSAANFEIEASDHASSGASYAAGVFNLTDHSTSGPGSPSTAPGPDGWQKVSVDLPTQTGFFIVAFYILKGGALDYAGDGILGITLGAITVEPLS